ncbi:hypothetical protein [Paraburkholderia diazotrophica]|uniref:Uncharacterized protein n=1 Tax=Paraburkholderia diazotrophica TaxID=667676 RepID=A0A1H6UX09_9BURK|nr:hypothetical protein [Paraburkholderia diazotrophica]SEI96196.1 hypothetical protein SAMN05192539_1005208 [Paraburkholderia diazotrophica]
MASELSTKLIREHKKLAELAGLSSAQSKYAHPKILLLDMGSDVEEALRERWADVVEGSLGTPYRVEKSAIFTPVIQHEELAGHAEAEIVIADLSLGPFDNGPTGEPHRPDGESDLGAKCDRGFIDCRIRTVIAVSSIFDRILKNGGVFVIFAAPRTYMTLAMGQRTYHGFVPEREVKRDVWSITSELADMLITHDAGRSIRVVDSSPVGTLLQKYLSDASFECTLKGGFRKTDPWQTLAVNKFGNAVGIMRRCGKGLTIVLPQLAQKAVFLQELMTIALPELAPHLFPEIERGRWANRAEYELPRVAELQAEKARIAAETEATLARLDTDIEAERAANGWLHDLLTETGDPLVVAVEKALAEIGFEHVVDMDKIRDQEGKSRREDLRIEDRSPLLIVDIKGIGGYPSDDDATQATKHAFINAKELKRTDVQGLAIINHQRHLPPLERENDMPFRQELLDVAGETGLGLLTTFDLYRMVVNMRKLDWPSEHVKAVVYGHQRIEPVPAHYRYIGTVAKAMTGKLGVVIAENEIAVGDRLAVEGLIYFDEADVASIRVNDKPVERAKVGDPAGFLWPDGNAKVREGMRVYAVPNSK